MFGKLHILYKDGKREIIEGVSRITNLSYKFSNSILYYETVNHIYGKGVSLDLENICCWELNFKNYL